MRYTAVWCGFGDSLVSWLFGLLQYPLLESSRTVIRHLQLLDVLVYRHRFAQESHAAFFTPTYTSFPSLAPADAPNVCSELVKDDARMLASRARRGQRAEHWLSRAVPRFSVFPLGQIQFPSVGEGHKIQHNGNGISELGRDRAMPEAPLSTLSIPHFSPPRPPCCCRAC